MARHKVDICGVNTANMKVLTNEENKELMKTNRADVLEKALEINENYFEIIDGEMRVKEFSFRFIKDDSWKGLKPINTNEIKGE